MNKQLVGIKYSKGKVRDRGSNKSMDCQAALVGVFWTFVRETDHFETFNCFSI